MTDPNLTPLRPHMYAAFHAWILENNGVPHITVDTGYPGVSLPNYYITGEPLLLNIRQDAISGYGSDEHGLWFRTRFNKVDYQVYIPFGALLAVSSKTPEIFLPLPPEVAYILNEASTPTPEVAAEDNVGRGLVDPVIITDPFPVQQVRPIRQKPVLTLVK